MNTEKPLFIPLKAVFYASFAIGEKEWEFRPNGPRWNERTCRVGRRVVLSRGYGKQHRMTGVIVDFRVDRSPTETLAWKHCYGEYRTEPAACIKIKVDRGAS